MIAPGLKASLPFSVGETEMTMFASLSGDRNPLHLDADFARRNGFAGRVVYGGLLVAMISRLIGMELPTRKLLWTRIALDFRAPLYVDEEAMLSAEVVGLAEAARAARLRITIGAGDRIIATGFAELALLGDA